MNSVSMYQRIACLSTEAVEVLYALGAEDYVVGISGYTTRPARARDEKPKVSGFSSAQIDRILAVKPDLVIAYSNMQSEISRELISAGIEVHAFNQRDVAGILHMIMVLANLVGKQEQGATLIAELQSQIDTVKQQSAGWTRRPKIYFEEWNDPLMSCIGWVSELIHIAGGEDAFADLAQHHSAKERIIADPAEIIRRAPDIIIGSWCGKKFRPDSVIGRDGWDHIPAVRNGRVLEIKSADILSPGPSAIQHGLLQLHILIAEWQSAQNY
ncbi:cobalamin-binding protein [Undibacterium sp. Tian12W]|uniref:cobalamin-binding protein n=1 Tax=Undibacterium sp. Tian12W TaxID=3413054 RepID=UPI003BEFF770